NLRQRCLSVPKIAVQQPAEADFVTNRFETLRYSRIGLIRGGEAGPLSGHRVPFGVNSPAASRPGGKHASMLPGFRFLFAAIVLSMSVLIFGLGAAALLRSAHEEFASLPSRRAPAEQVFT